MTSPTHIRGLDGIRGIAASLVIMHHTLFLNTHLGGVSVYLFFVLSGYLITGILRKSRAAIEQGASTVMAELRRFWVNRALRIFPVYYLTLAVVFLVSLHYHSRQELTRNILWYLAYAQNFLIACKTHRWGVFTQTWSLAVEQQFYALFPLIILGTHSRYAVRAMVLLYLMAAGALLVLFGLKFDFTAINLLPPLGFMFLFAGGCLSMLRINPATPDSPKMDSLPWLFALLLLLMAAMPENASDVWSTYLPLRTEIALLDIGIIGAALIGCIVYFQENSLVRFLENAPLRHLGKISYAMYVVHVPLKHIATSHFSGAFAPTELFLAVYACSVILATGSFYLIERPVLKCKSNRTPAEGI